MNTHKLVPIYPTPEMIHAGQMAVSGFPRDVLDRYQAMLAAAPEVEQEPVIVDSVDEIPAYAWHGPWHTSTGANVQFNLSEPHPIEVLVRDGERIKGWTGQPWSWEIEDGLAEGGNIVAWRFYDKERYEAQFSAKPPARNIDALVAAVKKLLDAAITTGQMTDVNRWAMRSAIQDADTALCNYRKQGGDV